MAALVGVLLAATFASSAQAAAYRYWTYWKASDSAWQFAQAGPAGTTPADGSVEGWRFAVSSTSGDLANEPRFDATHAFIDICGNTAAIEGKKRVALVVDPGLAEAAPSGDQPGPLKTYCAVVASDANGYDVLRSVGPVRVGSGLICAIDSYPTSGCADVVDQTQLGDVMSTAPSVQAATADQFSAVPVIIGVGALGALAALAWWLRRRR
ncbi:MAG: SCO2322 family protein [Actinomycetota bacterium]|nr:SCO2322 family protein [Actinomycetota bacterium]